MSLDAAVALRRGEFDLDVQVQAADGRRRGAGQRDVDAVVLEALAQLLQLELRAARADRGVRAGAHFVGELSDRAALLRRQVGDPAQQVRQLGLAAQEAHTRVLELLRRARGGDRREGILADPLDLGDEVAHAPGTLVSS